MPNPLRITVFSVAWYARPTRGPASSTKFRLPIVRFDEGSRQFVPQPEVEREPGGRYPIVLHKTVEYVLHVSEKEITKAAAGVRSVKGECRPRSEGRIRENRDALSVT